MDSSASPRVLSSFYNGATNVFWSLLAFAPVSIFCYRFMSRAGLWTFVATSFIAFVIPSSKLKYLELSSVAAPYRKLRVPWVNHFVQHGTLINRLLRQRYPEYRRARSRAGSASLLESTYVQERFHWAVLLFFLLTCCYAIARGYAGWALLITIINVGYNLYPIWLQQYIRVRLNRSLHAK